VPGSQSFRFAPELPMLTAQGSEAIEELHETLEGHFDRMTRFSGWAG
jgi:hypothetical protein